MFADVMLWLVVFLLRFFLVAVASVWLVVAALMFWTWRKRR